MIDSFKKYIYFSLGFHVLVVLILIIASSGGNIKQPFVVFGAHSKKEYHTLVPFLHHKGSRLNGTAKSGTKNQTSAGKNKQNNKKSGTNNSKVNSKKSNKVNSKKSNTKSKNGIHEPNNKFDPLDDEAFKKELKKMEMETQKEIDLENEIKAKKKKEKQEQEKKQKLEEKLKKEKQKETAEKAEQERLEKELEKQEQIEEKQTPEQPDGKEQEDTSGEESTGEPTDDETTAISEEFVFTLGAVDRELTEYQKHVQQEVSRLWKPPLGVPKGTTCKIRFTIGKDGKVIDFKKVKESDVLIYDLSILRIAHLFKFHKSLWGRNFEVDFLQ